MKETMKVVAIVDDHKVEAKQVAMPGIETGKITVKINACALCTWEQRIFIRESKVPLPFVGGHELVGEIYAVGEGIESEKYPVGQKVVVRLIGACGTCYYCRRGEQNLCTKSDVKEDAFLSVDGTIHYMGTGGLSQYLNVEPAQIFKMPQDIPDTTACFAEPLACVLNSIERGKIELGDDVVVIGGGIMGMLHVMAAKLSGARVIMSEPDPERRKLAEELGADIVFNPMEQNPVDYIHNLTDGLGAEVVFNTTPISAVAQQAIEMVAPMGRVIMYSSQHPDKPISVSPNWIHNTEAVITGAVSPSVRSFNRAVNLLSKGLIHPEKLMSGAFPIESAQEAFETAVRPDTFRCVIRLSE